MIVTPTPDPSQVAGSWVAMISGGLPHGGVVVLLVSYVDPTRVTLIPEPVYSDVDPTKVSLIL